MLGKPISPDDQRGFYKRLIEALERLEIPYAIGGSVAAMVYSEPRFTIDIDVMLDAQPRDLKRLTDEISAWQVYISPFSISSVTIASVAKCHRSIPSTSARCWP